MEFFEKLKLLRINANLTQEELTKKLYVSKEVISNYEQKRAYPTIEILIQICQIFSISIDELLTTRIKKKVLNEVLIFVSIIVCSIVMIFLQVFYAMTFEGDDYLIKMSMSILTYLIPLVVLIMHLVLKFIPPKKINSIYGYRTKRSMKNQLTWDFAQLYSKLVIGWINVVMIGISTIFTLVIFLTPQNISLILTIVLFVFQLIILCLSVFIIEKKLKKIFK